MTALLDVDDLCVSFRRYRGLFARETIPALRHLSLTVARGECVAMIGASGAGKSVLVDALLGQLPVNATQTGATTARGAIGLIPQSLAALDPLATVGAQMRWAHRDRGEEEDVDHRLARVGLDPSVARLFPHELSGGMARRVLIAMATAGAPDILLADEPTSGLDAANARNVLALVRAYVNRGCAALVISHDLVSVLRIADRVAVLKDGELTGTETTSAFAGDGRTLKSNYARALWCALPPRSRAWNAAV